MSEPYEIIAAPFTLYVAPVGTVFPLIDAAPSGSWIMVGTSGDRSETEEGVTVGHSQSINGVRSAGSTGQRKAFRTEEDLTFALTLMDISLEQYALAINGNDVATTAAGVGTAGFKALKLYRGVQVETMALLVRGVASAYGDGWNAQYEIPVCYQSGDAEPVFTKGEPAGVALEFTALEDDNAATPDMRFGRIVMQHAAALSE
jgi:hypothetical protein